MQTLVNGAGDTVLPKTLEIWKRRLSLLKENDKAAAKILDTVMCKLKIGPYAVQLLSDLSEAERSDRILKTWQNWDHSMFIIATAHYDPKSKAKLAKYWSSPEPLIPFWKHVVIVMFDHVPQPVKKLDEKILVDQAERAQRRKSGSGTVVVGTRGGGAAEKWRITSIMGQAVLNWFNSEAEPVGLVLPTVVIVYGTEACLEDVFSVCS